MEPKKEQIVRMMLDKVHAFVQKWWPVAILFCTAALWAAVMALILTSCRSTSEVIDTQHTTRDSVAIKYKTVLRDSIRIKDSVRIVTKIKVRDSVVLRIDNATGKVISKESYHSTDTNTDKNHVADVRNMVNKADSINSTASKYQNSIVNQNGKNNAAEIKKTHYWKTWWLGLVAGIVLSVAFKYRKSILKIFAKVV